MYAFCVLELEMHSNKVSIKKQQQAIQKVLLEQQREAQKQQQQQQQPEQQESQSDTSQIRVPTSINQANHHQSTIIQQSPPPTLQKSSSTQQQQQLVLQQNGESSSQQANYVSNGLATLSNDCDASSTAGKTLLQLQQEVAVTRKCYSDYQRTQVLTSSMLRDVQKRFSKYYPSSAIPSRTTIKHVFEKCVAHGTVENIKTPRKATKIPQGDEIEHLLIHEPQLSLRQMAQKLNVSTGTVSRRCRALGLIPESVTIKHQQLATARRQKQIKQLESQSKNSEKDGSSSIVVNGQSLNGNGYGSDSCS